MEDRRMKRRILFVTLVVSIGLCLIYPAISQQRREDREQRSNVKMIFRMLTLLLDLDKDNQISRDEYTKFFQIMDQNGDGFLTQKEVMESMKKKQQEESRAVQVRKTNKEGIEVGMGAPDFALKTLDGKKTIKLSNFKDKKPVVLIFASYT